MKICCISDTHNKHRELELPDADLLIHAGDFSGIGRRYEVEDVFLWFKEIAPKFKYGVVFIAGNHDRSFDVNFGELEYFLDEEVEKSRKNKPFWLKQILEEIEQDTLSIKYLENDWVIVDDVVIWGSPITPWFHGDRWAFNKHRGPDIREVWKGIPDGTHVVVTHGPPSFKGDFIPSTEEYVGCDDLRDELDYRVKPLLHVYGHIHEGYGVYGDGNNLYANASSCNEYYEIVNKPLLFEINRTIREIY
jgi:Icc-related predicted phosphoesterase